MCSNYRAFLGGTAFAAFLSDYTSLSRDQVITELVKVLRPDIDALWLLINSNFSTSKIKVGHKFPKLQPILPVIEQGLKHRGELPDSHFLLLEEKVEQVFLAMYEEFEERLS